MNTEHTDSKAVRLANYVVSKGITGLGPLATAEELAAEYLEDSSYSNHADRVKSLIRWETSKNFTSGFMTGLGGLITLPVSIPSGLGASWLIQARMCAAIACIYGHGLGEDRVRTLILLSLMGDSIKEVIKTAGIQFGEKAALSAIGKVPGRVLIEINKKVGFRLITKAGQKGVCNLIKFVPVAGGIVGGTIDAAACRGVGYAASRLFRETGEA